MGTNPTKIALLIGSLCSFSVIAPAMAAGDTSTAKVDEHLVVIGRSDNTPLNIAANVNVIDAAAIEMSGATSVTEVLRGQSGIQISDNNIIIDGVNYEVRIDSSEITLNPLDQTTSQPVELNFNLQDTEVVHFTKDANSPSGIVFSNKLQKIIEHENNPFRTISQNRLTGTRSKFVGFRASSEGFRSGDTP